MSTSFLSRNADNSPLAAVTLVLGGVRSGKSRFAEALVEATDRPIYLATAEALDDEMSDRITAHRHRRSAKWRTIEEPLEIASVLPKSAHPQGAVLVDCLTLWLSNLMTEQRDLDVETENLLQSLPTLAGPVVFVSTEVGLGGVSANAMARAYADSLGDLHQAIAARASRVYLVSAGIAQCIKNENHS